MSMSSLQTPTITSSGELYLLNGSTGGELQPMPFFVNKNLRVISANLDRAFVATEPTIWTSPDEDARPPCSVYCFRAESGEPEYCPEFESIKGPIRQIAFGQSHTLVLTADGTLYSRGAATYGSTGHGGARDVDEFTEIPALRGRKVTFMAAGPCYSIAVTSEGDVYSWGKAFYGETGLFTQVEAVPRFAPSVTPFKVTEISCGHSHVVARTEMQQCITWGENTCGQLGLGQKSKPTYKPQLLTSIPSQVAAVAAGWAHSLAVGTDGRAYSWGLNSHGQLGVGDTSTRMAPHLLHDLVGEHEVLACEAARAFSVFRTSAHKALMCGQIPPHPSGASMDFAPHRPGHHDPPGCMLAPVAISLTTGKQHNRSMAELSEIVAFDKGAIAFARSTVYKVTPNVAPIAGGTKIRAYVTGLPYDPPTVKTTTGSMSSTFSSAMVQNNINVQVRLRSQSPICDLIVKGTVVDKDVVEFETPDASPSPLGAVVEQGTTLPVQVRVSIDGGFTWTPDRYTHPASEVEQTLRHMPSEAKAGYGRAQGPLDIQKSLKDFKGDFQMRRKALNVSSQTATMLWYCRWPDAGPTHVEPDCAPVEGGTEVLVFVPLPARMPTDNLTVKFVCTPLKTIGDSELEARAPMRRDAAEIVNPCAETMAKLPLAGTLEVPVIAFLDPSGRGICCSSPPMDSECVKFYNYSVMVSLDGFNYMSRSLPFKIFDLHVTALEPPLGSLVEGTEVTVKTSGAVMSEIIKVRLDYPKDLRWPARTLPARYDHTTQEVTFTMPPMDAAVRQKVLEAQGGEKPGDAGADGASADGSAEASTDPYGGLTGLEVFVELSLNGQNFTEDHVHFCYIGEIKPEEVKLLPGPGGAEEEEVAKPKPGGKKTEEPEAVVLQPGARIGCVTTGLPASSLTATARAQIRATLAAGEGEDAQVLKTVDMPGAVETVPATEGTPEREMIAAAAPGIPSEQMPEGLSLYLKNFQVSLNGQSYTDCPEQPALRLEPLPPVPDES